VHLEGERSQSIETRGDKGGDRGNSVLIAGDDDQALYNFKSVSPDFIRDLASTLDRQAVRITHTWPECA
jgi:hypothetical protein